MGQPTWRELKTIDVPLSAGTAWTMALEYVKAGRALRFSASGKWQPEGVTSPIGADGDPLAPNAGSEFLDSAPFGALIGRVGISSAAATSTDYTFPIGRTAVLIVPPDKNGALFLGVNDHSTRMGKVTGPLKVTISEAL